MAKARWPGAPKGSRARNRRTQGEQPGWQRRSALPPNAAAGKEPAETAIRLAEIELSTALQSSANLDAKIGVILAVDVAGIAVLLAVLALSGDLAARSLAGWSAWFGVLTPLAVSVVEVVYGWARGEVDKDDIRLNPSSLYNQELHQPQELTRDQVASIVIQRIMEATKKVRATVRRKRRRFSFAIYFLGTSVLFTFGVAFEEAQNAHTSFWGAAAVLVTMFLIAVQAGFGRPAEFVRELLATTSLPTVIATAFGGLLGYQIMLHVWSSTGQNPFWTWWIFVAVTGVLLLLQWNDENAQRFNYPNRGDIGRWAAEVRRAQEAQPRRQDAQHPTWRERWQTQKRQKAAAKRDLQRQLEEARQELIQNMKVAAGEGRKGTKIVIVGPQREEIAKRLKQELRMASYKLWLDRYDAEPDLDGAVEGGSSITVHVHWVANVRAMKILALFPGRRGSHPLGE